MIMCTSRKCTGYIKQLDFSVLSTIKKVQLLHTFIIAITLYSNNVSVNKCCFEKS